MPFIEKSATNTLALSLEIWIRPVGQTSWNGRTGRSKWDFPKKKHTRTQFIRIHEYSSVMLGPGKAGVPNSQMKRAHFLSLFNKSQISWSQTVNKIYQNLKPNNK